MTTLATSPDLDHDYRDTFTWDLPDAPCDDYAGDPLTQVAHELASRRRDLQDLQLATHKLDEAALAIAEQLHDLDATLLDLQLDQAFNQDDDDFF